METENAQSNSNNNTDKLISDLNLSLERTTKLIERSDTKASIMIAALSIIFGIIFRDSFIKIAKKIVKHNLETLSFCNILYLLISVAAILGLFIGLTYLITTLIPRLNKKYTEETSSGDDSIYFFDSVSNMAFNDFTKLYKSTIDDSQKQILQIEKQLYINSEIASQKYHFLKRGIFISFTSILSLIILFVIGLVMLKMK